MEGLLLSNMIKNIVVKETKNKGKSVFALKKFKKGGFIFRYKKGKIIERKCLNKLTEWESDHIDELDNNKFELMNEPACFINHSCDPNTITKGRCYFALKSIKKGQEICVDYRSKGIFKNKWKCICGSKNCKGYVISDFFTLPEKVQRLYLPYTLKSIKVEYRKRQRYRKSFKNRSL